MGHQVDFQRIVSQIQALTEGIPYEIANLSNITALLWQELPELNWVGFYKMTDGALVLYPFQGKPACIRIPVGKGVCGTAAAEHRTVRVENVHEVPGHIACDGASNSEIVLPLYRQDCLWGVLDLDSPVFGRFTPEDQQGLELVCRTIEALL